MVNEPHWSLTTARGLRQSNAELRKILRLSEHLDVPFRARHVLLNAAGYAPVYVERPLDDPALAQAREAVDLVLRGHELYSALAIDRHWTPHTP